jgi:hypothetical protein
VYTSPYINPDYVLSQLPPDSLLEIRALMLERLNRHSEALQLYVHGLHNLGLAEAYCDRVYEAAVADLGASGQRPGAWGAARGRGATIPEGDYVLRYGANASDIYMELLDALMDKVGGGGWWVGGVGGWVEWVGVGGWVEWVGVGGCGCGCGCEVVRQGR